MIVMRRPAQLEPSSRQICSNERSGRSRGLLKSRSQRRRELVGKAVPGTHSDSRVQ